jgi:hypothetical protein
LQTNESENNPDVEIYKKNGSTVTTEDYSIGNDNTTAFMGAKLGKKRNAPPRSGVLTANRYRLTGRLPR